MTHAHRPTHSHQTAFPWRWVAGGLALALLLVGWWLWTHGYITAAEIGGP